MIIFEKNLIYGDQRTIVADPNRTFLYWSGNTQYLADSGSSTTTVTITDSNVRVKAVYEVVFELCVGYLYNTVVATDIRNIAPIGWRVPTETDFSTLLELNYTDQFDAAQQLMDNNIEYWNVLSGFTNSSELTLRGGGITDASESFFSSFYCALGEVSFYCSSTPGDGDGVMVALFASIEFMGSNIGVNVTNMPSIIGSSLILVKEDSILENMTDNNGNVYETVKIGNQVWTKTAIKSTKFRNGDDITRSDVAATWLADAGIVPYYTIYGASPDDCN